MAALLAGFGPFDLTSCFVPLEIYRDSDIFFALVLTLGATAIVITGRCCGGHLIFTGQWTFDIYGTFDI